MKAIRFISAILFASALCLSCKEDSGRYFQPVDYVNTLVGTQSTYQMSTGNTYPAVGLPWGKDFWSPQTGKNGDGWMYTYDATHIRGLKQTHQPSPWINDYGEFSIMPVTKRGFSEDERASWFSHKGEKATPYYYSVYLADHDVLAEISPVKDGATLRFTYPERDTSWFVVDAYKGGEIVSFDENSIVGYTVMNHGGVSDNFKMWFAIRSEKPLTFKQIDPENSLAIAGFGTHKGEKVGLAVASSFISKEQALLNLERIDCGFDEAKNAARDRWNEVLGRIEVNDNDIDHLRTFYSCLYRSVLFPRDLAEIDASGKTVHYSPHDGKVHEGHLFTDTGFWDTFRCLFALMDLVYPEKAAEVQEGLVNTWKESGFLPEWASPGHRRCMVGNNSASVVAEAYLKGIRGNYNPEDLWKAVTFGAHNVHPKVSSTGRLGHEYYDSLGYVPCDVGIKESAARTLEYAYDDWCIWQFGKALGKSEEELAHYKKASENYRNLFFDKYRLMAGRRLDGTFAEPFSPLKWGGDFTEGNSLHYTWSVFHNPDGLKELMGGEENFIAMLDSVFNIPPLFDDSYYGHTIHEIREMQTMNMGNYAHGNQPVQHMIYLYDWTSQPWKAQMRVREVMDRLYSATPDGYCGDEDNGQTSAWYVFSALGFYPVCPASCEYALGIPLFKEVTIHLPSGKDITISAPGNDRSTDYVRSVKMNGHRLKGSFITHEDLLDGARLNFTVSERN